MRFSDALRTILQCVAEPVFSQRQKFENSKNGASSQNAKTGTTAKNTKDVKRENHANHKATKTMKTRKTRGARKPRKRRNRGDYIANNCLLHFQSLSASLSNFSVSQFLRVLGFIVFLVFSVCRFLISMHLIVLATTRKFLAETVLTCAWDISDRLKLHHFPAGNWLRRMA